MSRPPNYFAVLGVSRASSKEELKAARDRAARAVHPDKGGSAEAMAQVNLAYKTLVNPRDRRNYLILLGASGRRCDTCSGTGVRRLQKGFRKVPASICDACQGSGVIL